MGWIWARSPSRGVFLLGERIYYKRQNTAVAVAFGSGAHALWITGGYIPRNGIRLAVSFR